MFVDRGDTADEDIADVGAGETDAMLKVAGSLRPIKGGRRFDKSFLLTWNLKEINKISYKFFIKPKNKENKCTKCLRPYVLDDPNE